MTKSLGQTVLVENKVGAGGTIAATYVARAAPDGYTFLIHHIGMATAPALYRKLAFDPVTDFEYVGQVVDVPMTLLARKDLPPKNYKELESLRQGQRGQDQPGQRRPGRGLAPVRPAVQEPMGVKLTTMPFQGTGPAINALLGGQVDLLCDQTTNTVPHIKAGTVKVYGVTTQARSTPCPTCPRSTSRA